MMFFTSSKEIIANHTVRKWVQDWLTYSRDKILLPGEHRIRVGCFLTRDFFINFTIISKKIWPGTGGSHL
jgi:hypothetical protein